jgi:hypothetical protein
MARWYSLVCAILHTKTGHRGQFRPTEWNSCQYRCLPFRRHATDSGLALGANLFPRSIGESFSPKYANDSAETDFDETKHRHDHLPEKVMLLIVKNRDRYANDEKEERAPSSSQENKFENWINYRCPCWNLTGSRIINANILSIFRHDRWLGWLIQASSGDLYHLMSQRHLIPPRHMLPVDQNMTFVPRIVPEMASGRVTATLWHFPGRLRSQ